MAENGVPQLTFRAVLLAIVPAVVLSAANACLGLLAGLRWRPLSLRQWCRWACCGCGAAAASWKTTSSRPALGRLLDRGGGDLHHSGPDHPRRLGRLPLCLGPGHRRPGRAVGRAGIAVDVAIYASKDGTSWCCRSGSSRAAWWGWPCSRSWAGCCTGPAPARVLRWGAWSPGRAERWWEALRRMTSRLCVAQA